MTHAPAPLRSRRSRRARHRDAEAPARRTGAAAGILRFVVEIAASHPDVDIELTGSADTCGAAGYNRRLALRRIASVEAHLLAMGIDPARLHKNVATAGESSAQGAQGAGAGAAGSLQSNRRVEVRYQRMMSLP